MKSGHATKRDLAWALRQQAKRAGEQSPSVRGSDWRLATVTAVNADGTIIADGITARRMELYANPAVGDVIRIDQSSNGNWVALGRLATTAGTAWTTYTPTWTASTTNPSLGNGTLVGRYQKTGRLVACHINLAPGSTTTLGSGGYSFAIPFAAANAGCSFVGTAQLLGAARWAGHCVVSPAATTTSPFFSASATDTRLTVGSMTATAPESFGDGDQLRLTLIYESAS